MTHAVRWAVAAGMLAVGVLPGCDSSPEGPDPTPTPSPSVSSSSASPSASSSPSPSASGPKIPAAAREKTPAGAEAYVRYFFDQFNVAWTKPQAGLIRLLSDPACKFCAKSESDAEELAKDQHKYARAPLSLTASSAFGGAPSGQQFVSVDLTQNAAQVVDSKGLAVRSIAEKRDTFYATLRWRDGVWRLLELEKTS